jgi:hypothetical protein
MRPFGFVPRNGRKSPTTDIAPWRASVGFVDQFLRSRTPVPIKRKSPQLPFQATIELHGRPAVYNLISRSSAPSVGGKTSVL